MSATLGTDRAKLPEGFLSVDGIAPLDIVEAFTNQTIDFLRWVFLTGIAHIARQACTSTAILRYPPTNERCFAMRWSRSLANR